MQVNLIFICDLILQFFLHYQTGSEDGGTWVGSRPAIAMNYLKGNFIIECVLEVTCCNSFSKLLSCETRPPVYC